MDFNPEDFDPELLQNSSSNERYCTVLDYTRYRVEEYRSGKYCGDYTSAVIITNSQTNETIYKYIPEDPPVVLDHKNTFLFDHILYFTMRYIGVNFAFLCTIDLRQKIHGEIWFTSMPSMTFKKLNIVETKHTFTMKDPQTDTILAQGKTVEAVRRTIIKAVKTALNNPKLSLLCSDTVNLITNFIGYESFSIQVILQKK